MSEYSLMYSGRVIGEQTGTTRGAGPGCIGPRQRAVSLPPHERRAALIAATLPLLIEHGTALTTRQIAEAAGIAEGTIFRVFPDKDSLIAAAIEQAFDPGPMEAELRAIDPALTLDARLERAVEILQHRFGYVGQLMMAVGMNRPPGTRWGRGDHRPPPNLDTLAAVFEPDRARLRRDPLQAAQLLRGLSFAGSHPSLIIDKPLTPAEIVSVVLDGIRIDDSQARRSQTDDARTKGRPSC